MGTLIKGCIVRIDATPFRTWYESHYTLPLGRKKAKLTREEEEVFTKKRSKKTQKKYDDRKKTAKVEQAVEDQFGTLDCWLVCPPALAVVADVTGTSWKARNWNST